MNFSNSFNSFNGFNDFHVFINLHYSHEFKFLVLHYYIQNKTRPDMVFENHIGVLIVNVPSLLDAYRNAILCFYQTLVFDFPIFLQAETRTHIYMDIPLSLQDCFIQEILHALPLNCTIVNMEMSHPMFALRESCMYYMLSKIYARNVAFITNKKDAVEEKEKEAGETEKVVEETEKSNMTRSKKRRLQRKKAKERGKEQDQENEKKAELGQIQAPIHFLHKFNTNFNQLLLVKDFTNHVYLYKVTGVF